MSASQKFSTFSLFPECPEKDPKTLFTYVTSPSSGDLKFDITNSEINTTAKSVEFFYLLKKITINVTMTGRTSSLPSYETSSASTYWEFLKNDATAVSEPFERSCLPKFAKNGTLFLITQLIFPFFLTGSESTILLHSELELDIPSFSNLDGTLEYAGFFITTFDRDFGFTANFGGGDIVYVDQSVPVSFENPNTGNTFEFFVKFITPNGDLLTLDSASIDCEFYTIA